jgi:hypothetical protein
LQNAFNASDKLLYTLSGKELISWREFKTLFDRFAIVDEEHTSQFSKSSLLRIMQSLGHCDADFSEGRANIHIAPMVFARLPWRGMPTAVLCGWRSPELISRLDEICSRLNLAVEQIAVNEQPSESGLVPVRISIVVDNVQQLQLLASESNTAFDPNPPCWSMLNMSGSLFEYAGKLAWDTYDDLSWSRRYFDPEQIKFREDFRPLERFLVRYENPQRGNSFVHLLVDGNRCAKVDVDFGRYLILSRQAKSLLFYDRNKNLFAAPLHAPLPPIMAKCLTLCSGWAPYRIDTQHFGVTYPLLAFRMVPEQVALTIANKLGLEMSTQQL